MKVYEVGRLSNKIRIRESFGETAKYYTFLIGNNLYREKKIPSGSSFFLHGKKRAIISFIVKKKELAPLS